MSDKDPLINICRYKVKPGKEAEMERLLARHWPALHTAGLVTDEKARVYRGLPSGKPDGPPRRQSGLHRVHGVEGPRRARLGASAARRDGRVGADGRDLRGDGLSRLRASRPVDGPVKAGEARSKAERELLDFESVFGALAHALPPAHSVRPPLSWRTDDSRRDRGSVRVLLADHETPFAHSGRGRAREGRETRARASLRSERGAPEHRRGALAGSLS